MNIPSDRIICSGVIEKEEGRGVYGSSMTDSPSGRTYRETENGRVDLPNTRRDAYLGRGGEGGGSRPVRPPDLVGLVN